GRCRRSRSRLSPGRGSSSPCRSAARSRSSGAGLPSAPGSTRAGNRRSSGSGSGVPSCSSATPRTGTATSISRTTSRTWPARTWYARSIGARATSSSCGTSRTAPPSSSIRSAGASSRFAEEAQLEDGTPAVAAIGSGDASAEPLHARVTEREPEAGSLPRLAGGEERLEQAGQRMRRNSRAVVLHLDEDGSRFHPRRHADAGSPGVCRVREEIDEDLRDVVLVAPDLRQIARQLQLEGDVRLLRRHRRPRQLDGPPKIDRLQLRRRPRQIEEIAEDAIDAPRLPLDPSGILGDVPALREALADQRR